MSIIALTIALCMVAGLGAARKQAPKRPVQKTVLQQLRECQKKLDAANTRLARLQKAVKARAVKKMKKVLPVIEKPGITKGWLHKPEDLDAVVADTDRMLRDEKKGLVLNDETIMGAYDHLSDVAEYLQIKLDAQPRPLEKRMFDFANKLSKVLAKADEQMKKLSFMGGLQTPGLAPLTPAVDEGVTPSEYPYEGVTPSEHPYTGPAAE